MKKQLTEFIGTFFLVLTVGLAVKMGAGAMAAIAIGAALMVMVYAGGHISGAHYNPAVTLAILIRGRIAASEAILYMISQLVAAAVAALTVNYLADDAMPAETIKNIAPVKALIGEVLGTFALAYVVLNVATAKATNGNSYYGLAIGFTVTAMAYALGSFSAGAFNPAVALGAVVMKMANPADSWIYLIGCFGGGTLAALVFKINNPEN